MISFDDQIREEIRQTLKDQFDEKMEARDREWQHVCFLAGLCSFIFGMIAGIVVGLFVFSC